MEDDVNGGSIVLCLHHNGMVRWERTGLEDSVITQVTLHPIFHPFPWDKAFTFTKNRAHGHNKVEPYQSLVAGGISKIICCASEPDSTSLMINLNLNFFSDSSDSFPNIYGNINNTKTCEYDAILVHISVNNSTFIFTIYFHTEPFDKLKVINIELTAHLPILPSSWSSFGTMTITFVHSETIQGRILIQNRYFSYLYFTLLRLICIG